MKAFVRHGRRIPIPSTIQILYELRVFSAQENIRELCAEAEGLPTAASWDAICEHRAAASRGAGYSDDKYSASPPSTLPTRGAAEPFTA